MAIYNERVAFTKEELTDHYARRDSIWSLIYGIIRFLVIIVQNLYCVSSYLVLSWIIFFPICWIRTDLYSSVENCLYNSLLFIVSSWSAAAGIVVVETGDDYKNLIEEPDTIQQDNLGNKTTKHGEFINRAEKRKYNSKTNSNNNNDYHSVYNNNSIIPNGNDIRCRKVAGDTNRLIGRNYPPRVMIFRNTNYHNDYQSLGSTEPKTIDQRSPRILLLCNHISTADVPLMMQSLSTLTNQSILWVLDSQFKFTQFGIVCSSHGDFFVAENSFVDGSLRDQVLRHPDRNLLMLFPEGGFLRKRLEGSNRYAEKNNLSRTKYVTHPRFGAFKDLIDPSVGVTHIVDATLMYNDIKNPLSILNVGLGNRKEPVLIHYKVYNRSEINPTEEWLRSIWLEKDKLLEKYYEDRNSLHKLFKGPLRAIKLDWFKVLSVHLFYLLVCYLTIYRMFSATNTFMLTAKEMYYSNI